MHHREAADMRKTLLTGLLAVVAANVVAADGGAPLRGGVCIGPFRGADSVVHCEHIGKVTIRQIYERAFGSFTCRTTRTQPATLCWLSRSRRDEGESVADAVCRAALDALASRAGVGMAGTARMATHPRHVVRRPDRVDSLLARVVAQ
ncbi:hypothetical protein J4732_15250 [Serratia marcescens]|uniref:Uncharacterized protein n=1 Tax=Serratia marcescens TaxID=615 RepID=A0A939NK96_SERMA|nr:hypothetical protein [Serratia marcescens]